MGKTDIIKKRDQFCSVIGYIPKYISLNIEYEINCFGLKMLQTKTNKGVPY